MTPHRPSRTARLTRLVAAVVLGGAVHLTGQAFQITASAASVEWVDGGDDSPCLNDDTGAAIDKLPTDQWCTPIGGCYQDDDGKWVLPSRKTGIWQGDPSQVKYADEIKATPTPTPKPTTPKPTTPKPTTSTPTTSSPSTGSSGSAAGGLAIDEDEVAVPGAPTAPEAPTLTVDDDAITVTWAPTADAALESVTGYQVLFSGADPVDVDATTTSHVFADLEDGSYRAAVRAVNANGPSVASSPSEPVTIGDAVADTKGEVTVDGELVPGQSVVLNGTGYAADVAELTIELHSDPVVLGTVDTDAEGAFTTTVTIPADVPVGQHSIVVLHDDVEVTSTPVQVGSAEVEEVAAAPAADRVPPHTGAAILAALGLAGILSLVWHVVTGRRRARLRTLSPASLSTAAGVS